MCKEEVKLMEDVTFGTVQFNLGTTVPPKEYIAFLIFSFKVGKISEGFWHEATTVPESLTEYSSSELLQPDGICLPSSKNKPSDSMKSIKSLPSSMISNLVPKIGTFPREEVQNEGRKENKRSPIKVIICPGCEFEPEALNLNVPVKFS